MMMRHVLHVFYVFIRPDARELQKRRDETCPSITSPSRTPHGDALRCSKSLFRFSKRAPQRAHVVRVASASLRSACFRNADVRGSFATHAKHRAERFAEDGFDEGFDVSVNGVSMMGNRVS